MGRGRTDPTTMGDRSSRRISNEFPRGLAITRHATFGTFGRNESSHTRCAARVGFHGFALESNAQPARVGFYGAYRQHGECGSGGTGGTGKGWWGIARYRCGEGGEGRWGGGEGG